MSIVAVLPVWHINRNNNDKFSRILFSWVINSCHGIFGTSSWYWRMT